MNVRMIQKHDLPYYWAYCEPLIEKGLLPAQGEADVKHVLQLLEAGLAHLIIGTDDSDVVHAALVIQFLQMPNYKVAHVFSVGGRGVIENAHHWKAIRAWMKANGAVKAQGVCRPAQARLWSKLGFETVYQVIRQDI